MIGSVIELNLYHQKVQPLFKLKLQHIPSKKGRRGDNVVNYQKCLTLPPCIYNVLDYPEHGRNKLLFNSGTYLPICCGTVVKVLCYKSEGRWFDSRWCHWNFSLT
jgi:hypothetical protein